jgi:uncharacterized protein YjeT (DUF2065 family)
MLWSDLLAACALYLVLEGIMPFLNPRGMRRALIGLAQLEDGTLRAIGLCCMIAGAVLLYWVRG